MQEIDKEPISQPHSGCYTGSDKDIVQNQEDESVPAIEETLTY